jgi:hypothetical protein
MTKESNSPMKSLKELDSSKCTLGKKLFKVYAIPIEH